ncbi:MAG: type 1 glutamine amidotransferase [Actinomycetales bacterium]|nr:MAG: type 1 glutamine amidotransferase [Actinomycetales bacterium]
MAEKGKKIILAIQNDPTDPPHLVGRWLMEIGFDIRILRAYTGEVVPTKVPDDVCALLPLGGSMGANDDEELPWLADEKKLLADAVAREIPIFAICLGAQLLATALDGEVSRAQVGEIGIYRINRNSISDSIFNFGESAISAQWHEDKISKLPTGAVNLASSELCENQIYRIGKATYAVQFHPEIDSGIIKLWEDDADNAFLESGKSSVKAEVRVAEIELEEIWKPIIQNWGRLILQ